MKRVLLLGASGLIAPHMIPLLEPHYELVLGDIKAHPQGRAVEPVDITVYEQVLAAARGVDAILNCTVNRGDPVQSFRVNVNGCFHVLRAAVELGIRKVVHTGPQQVWPEYHHFHDVDDPPGRGGPGYYGYTKTMSLQLCQAYAREHGLQVVCFLYCHLGAAPTERQVTRDFHPFSVVWEDVVEACRLAIEMEQVPGNYQSFNLHSHPGHGKYRLDKAARILGFRPQLPLEELYRRPLTPPPPA